MTDRKWYSPQNLPEFDLNAQQCWHAPRHQQRTETPTVQPPGLMIDVRCDWCSTHISRRWVPARTPDLT